MDRSLTYYLAGPMSGIPQFNFPAFISAAEVLRSRGYKIVSPAELDDEQTRELSLRSADGAIGTASPHGQTWGDFLARDVKLIADGVQGIIFLRGWRYSRGAKLEAMVGLLCGHKFGYYTESDYGHVLEPLSRSQIIQQLGASL